MRFASHAIRSILRSFFGAATLGVVLSPAAWAASVTAHFSAIQIQVASCTCYGVAVDSSGNVYIADTNNGKVWKETLSNGAYTQSLVAGSFNKPYGVAVDTSGNVYVADTDNHRIVKETLSSGSYTSKVILSGLATAPYNVAVDASGNVYVAGGNSSAPYVYKLSPSGSTYTKTNIVGASSGMQTPWEVNLDSNGNVFVTDSSGNSVYKFTLSGSSYVQSTVATALNNPMGVAVDANGNVYVSNANTNQIVLESPSASAYTQSVFATGTLNLPYQLAVDANGSLYIANPQTGNILREDRAGNFGPINVGEESQPFDVVFAFDSAGTINAPAVLTQGAANLDFGDTGTGTCTTNGTSHSYQAGDVCIVNTDFYPKYAGERNGAVVLKDSTGAPIATAYIYGVGVAPQAVFSPPTVGPLGGSYSQWFGVDDPVGVAVDSSGNIYASEGYLYNEVKEIPVGCASSACVKTLGGGFGEIGDLAVDGSGYVYVVDYKNNIVKEIPPGCATSTCVTALGGGFNNPGGVAVDGSGNIYVTDMQNNAVKEIPAGCTASRYSNNLCAVKTLAGNFTLPRSIAVDSGGNVYVGEFIGGQAVMEIPAGCASSACVTALGGGFYDAGGGVAVDPAGNVYAQEFGMALIKVMPAGCASSACVTTLALGGGIDLALDSSGNLYTAETYIMVIYRASTAVTFASTWPGSKSSDSPQIVTVQNIGNATLNFPAPSTGNNPSVSSNFLWNDSSTCEQTDPSSPNPFSLAEGATCTFAIDFAPTTVGNISGSVALTDNALNTAAPNYATQTISLNGYSGTAAALTSPTPNSLLAGPQITFKWSAASGAAGYELEIGTYPGTNDLYTTGLTSATSATPANLPANGETIYVTLTTFHGDGSVHAAYKFTTATEAAPTSPAPKSVLAGSTVTFNWSTAPGSTDYIFRLGTTGPGSNDLFGSGPITTTSVTLANLPTNGEIIYARLYTLYGSIQVYTDYTLTAATLASALTSPTPNAVLAGPKVTFNWSAAPEAFAYQLWVGTSVGAKDLYASTWTTSTAVTRYMPLNGETIYVRLTTIYGAGKGYNKAYNDYVYTAATPAALTSPAPNSTLSGSAATFNWSAATGGASSYILRLGTTPGANNLFGSGQITATTVTPTKLPTNGETIYARLLTIYPSGAQVYNDYTFTAAP